MIKIKTDKLNNINYYIKNDNQEQEMVIINKLNQLDAFVYVMQIDGIRELEDYKNMNKELRADIKELFKLFDVYIVKTNTIYNNMYIATSVPSNIIDDEDEYSFLIIKNINQEKLFIY